MPKIRMPGRSFYDRTHDLKGPINFGLMYPVLHEEIIPGDTFSLTSEILFRMQPMIRPVMHEISAYLRVFFVRDWTIMEDFEQMISMGPDGESDVVVPFNPANYTVEEGSVWDWLNVNPGVYDADSFSLLPLRAYNKVYNDWYRPQNQIPDEVDLDDATMKFTTWERDLFTSALPFTQRGPQVVMPLGTTALVSVYGGANYSGSLSVATPDRSKGYASLLPKNGLVYAGEPGSTPDWQYTEPQEGQLYADLSTASGIAINDWRNYLQVQSWLELNAIGGVRYPELVLQHFGVVTPDARVERAEYLGSMKVPIVVSEVLQTGSSDSESPQGNMAGHGIGANRRGIFKRSFTEHGWLIGILTVVPKTGYQQGIPLEYQRRTALDFPWPLFTRLGMRDMPLKTLYTGRYVDSNGNITTPDNGTWEPVSNPNKTFGYYTIYDELRYKTNTVHGSFRSSMAYWHLGRIFGTEPNLSAHFVECHAATDRILAVPSEEAATIQILHRLNGYRELPKAPTPWHF